MNIDQRGFRLISGKECNVGGSLMSQPLQQHSLRSPGIKISQRRRQLQYIVIIIDDSYATYYGPLSAIIDLR